MNLTLDEFNPGRGQMQLAACIIANLEYAYSFRRDDYVTVYNWGAIAFTGYESRMGFPGTRS